MVCRRVEPARAAPQPVSDFELQCNPCTSPNFSEIRAIRVQVRASVKSVQSVYKS
jgi:hypothetical protein